MPKISGKTIRAAFQNNSRSVAKALMGTLTENGYSVTQGWVEDEVRRLLDDGKPDSDASKILDYWLSHGIRLKVETPHAPKSQSCPSCGKQAKRTYKGQKIAKYYCNKCKLETVVSLK